MTYTIQNLPSEIDEALRARAAAENKSVDRVVIDAIERGLELD